MFVNFEFLGREPIENVITFLNFKMDKAVFFGYYDVILAEKGRTANFLKKYCGVQEVKFQPVSEKNLDSVLKVLRGEIRREIEAGNQIYFDLTDGESLIFVALGMLMDEFDLQLHRYDVVGNKLMEFHAGRNAGETKTVKNGGLRAVSAAGKMSKTAPARRIHLNIDQLIEMHGGVINYYLHKDLKGAGSAEFKEMVMRLWEVSLRYRELWNPFSDFCNSCFRPDEELRVCVSVDEVREILAGGRTALDTEEELQEILLAVQSAGAIADVSWDYGYYMFSYASEESKACIREGGSLLELYVYYRCEEVSDDCRIGVHIDWDGVIHSAPCSDVLNEIDVLALNGNVPVFLSCKSGKMGSPQVLHALYELQTVAARFGGKHARKVLVSVRPFPGEIYYERAEEMGIEVRIVGESLSGPECESLQQRQPG